MDVPRTPDKEPGKGLDHVERVRCWKETGDFHGFLWGYGDFLWLVGKSHGE